MKKEKIKYELSTMITVVDESGYIGSPSYFLNKPMSMKQLVNWLTKYGDKIEEQCQKRQELQDKKNIKLMRSNPEKFKYNLHLLES